MQLQSRIKANLFPSILGAYNLELISKGNLDKLFSFCVEMEEKYSPLFQHKFWSVSSPIKSSKWREMNSMVFFSHMANPANHSCHHYSQNSLLLWQSLFVNWLAIPTEGDYSYLMLPKQLYQMPLQTFLPIKSPGLKTISISDMSRNSGLVGLVTNHETLTLPG